MFKVEKREGGFPGREEGMGNGIANRMWTKGRAMMCELQCSWSKQQSCWVRGAVIMREAKIHFKSCLR